MTLQGNIRLFISPMLQSTGSQVMLKMTLKGFYVTCLVLTTGIAGAAQVEPQQEYSAL